LALTYPLAGTASAAPIGKSGTGFKDTTNVIYVDTHDAAPQPMQPSWPADSSWILIDSDPDESGASAQNFRDVLYTYYQYDSEYLYFRMQTVDPPTFQSVQGRYKWFIDLGTGDPLQKSGNTISGSEYVFFVEDCDDDTQGDTYLIPALSGGGYSGWSVPPCPPQAASDNAGYRFGSGGNFFDQYVKLSALGTPQPPIYQISLAWATDNENPNLEQAPNLDSTDSGDVPIRLSGSITILKNAVPDDAQDFQFSGDLGSFILDDDTDPTYPNSLTFYNLPPYRYDVTESVPLGWNLSISGAPSTGNTANIDLGPGDNITVTFTNTLVATPPTVDDIEIYSDAGLSNPVSLANPMTPQSTYYAKATVSSSDTLAYLQTVQITIFYDSVGTDPIAPITSDNQTCAMLTCTVGPPPSWTIEPNNNPPNPPNNTTWQMVSGECSQPANLDVTTGDWVFAFVPGKVATESVAPADWDAQSLATNQANQSGELYVRDKAMNWYGEITVPASVDWGTVPMGLTFENATYNPQTASIKYIANGDYFEDIKSSDNWTGSGEYVMLDVTGGNPPPTGMFALMADNTANLGSALVVTTLYKHINASGGLTGEDGVTVNTNSLWLSLCEIGIAPVLYSGTIYLQIAER